MSTRLVEARIAVVPAEALYFLPLLGVELTSHHLEYRVEQNAVHPPGNNSKAVVDNRLRPLHRLQPIRRSRGVSLRTPMQRRHSLQRYRRAAVEPTSANATSSIKSKVLFVSQLDVGRAWCGYMSDKSAPSVWHPGPSNTYLIGPARVCQSNVISVSSPEYAPAAMRALNNITVVTCSRKMSTDEA